MNPRTKFPMLASLAALALSASAAPALGEEPIRVGALLAVTGPASFLGAPEARTLEMLVEEINARGASTGGKVQLVVKDTGASPEKAISFAKQLIEEEKVFAIIGPSTSGETMAVKALAEEGRTILLSCAAAEMIVEPGRQATSSRPRRRTATPSIRIFQQMKKMGITKIGVLTSNTGFGKAGKEQLEKLAPKYGITIAISEVYDKARHRPHRRC